MNKFQIFFKYFFLILFVVTIISFIIMLIIEEKMVAARGDEIQKEEKLFVAIEKEVFIEAFDIVISDLEYLRETFDQENHHLNEYWRIFSDKNKVYDQIRFIDVYGNEKRKIDYNKSIPTVIPSQYLNNVKDKEYFVEAAKLEDGQVYVSQQNIDPYKGKVFTALNPEILFSTPVYNNEEFIGVIVLNYNAKYLLYKISNISINSNGYVYVLDDKGNWLYSSSLKDRWGFLNANKKDENFATRFPYEWNNLTDSCGSIITDNGLFTYSDVTLSDRYGLRGDISPHKIFFSKDRWKLVSYIDAESNDGYYISNNLVSIAKMVVKEKYYNILYMAILSFIITLLILKNKVSMLKIKYIYEFDPMTDVYNRRAGFIRLGRCIINIINNKSICLCFLDVNGLKEVNDKFGHNVGDELILSVVHKIKQNIRETDFIIRLGGDEFLIVLPKTAICDAEKIWERITQSYDEVNIKENRPYLISVSHGMAEINSIINKEGLEKIITQADDKMYAEKRIIKRNIKIIR